MRSRRPDKKWTTLIEASDKAPSQFFSKSAVRACAEWLSSNQHGIVTLIKVFAVTDHGCFEGDGEGGADKRVVDEFIKNEETWRTRLPHLPADADKPVINSAKAAYEIARILRCKTRSYLYVSKLCISCLTHHQTRYNARISSS